jgi:hypothetical protein
MERFGVVVIRVLCLGVMELFVRVVGDTANIVCFVVWLQQIVLIAGDCVNRIGMERFGVVVIRVLCLGVMEQGVRVAGNTANIVCFGFWIQQIVLIAGDCVNRNGMERVEVVASNGKVWV